MKQPCENFDGIDIQLAHGLSADIADDLSEKLRQITPSVSCSLSREPGTYASLDMVVMAAIAICVGKPYLEAFFTELGVQSAKGLTNALASVFRKAKDKNLRLRTAKELRAAARELELAEAQHREPDRALTDGLGRPVPVLSITLVLDLDAHLRFTFPYELEDEALGNALFQLPGAVATVLCRRDEAAVQEPTSVDELISEDIYIYRSDRGEWIDVKLELKAELDAILHSVD